jgi:hypothetical protein
MAAAAARRVLDMGNMRVSPGGLVVVRGVNMPRSRSG